MSLRSTIATALRWSVGGRIAAQALSWLSTLIVIRLLQPEDYGLLAMGMSVAALAMLLNDMGLTSAIVQERDLKDNDIRNLLGLTLLCSGILFVLLFGIAPLVASYYQEAEVTGVLRALALQLPIQSFGLVYASLLVKKMNFKMQAIIETGSLLAGSFSTLGMALAGFGIWSLILGYLLTSSARSLGFVLTSSKQYRPSWRIDRVLPMAKFGAAIVAQRAVWWFYSQIDIMLLGRLYQAEAVGIYSIAHQLAALPHHKAGAALNQVTLASFAHLQHGPARLRDYLLQAIRMLAFVTVPVFAAISALAPEAVLILLGEKWLGAVSPIRILALIMPLRMVSAVISEVLNARGHPSFMLGNMFILLAVVGLALVVGSVWGGVLGVCIAWVVAFPAAFAITTTRSRIYTRLTIGDILQSLARPVVGAIVMYTVVELLRGFLGPQIDPLPLLVLLAIAAALSCAGTALLVDRSLFRDVLSFARS